MHELYTDILGISELKWIGIGHFCSEDHIVYYSGDKKKKEGMVLLS